MLFDIDPNKLFNTILMDSISPQHASVRAEKHEERKNAPMTYRFQSVSYKTIGVLSSSENESQSNACRSIPLIWPIEKATT